MWVNAKLCFRIAGIQPEGKGFFTFYYEVKNYCFQVVRKQLDKDFKKTLI